MDERERQSDDRGDNASVVRHEEEVAEVDKRWRGVGYVEARKRVETVHVRESIPREVEDVALERVPARDEDSGEIETLEDGSISIPVYEERLVVSKERVLKERVIIRKHTVTRHERVSAELKRERVAIDVDGGVEFDAGVEAHPQDGGRDG